MDQKDQFGKWLAAIEEALTTETSVVDEELLEQGECGCGNWDCEQCFPDSGAPAAQGGQTIPAVLVIGAQGGAPAGADMGQQDPAQQGVGMAGAKPVECPTCGHSHEDADSHAEPETGELEIPMMGGEDDMAFDEEDDQMQMDTTPNKKLPRSANGGVTLGHIVQRFDKVNADGEDSPLTFGDDNLDEEGFDGQPEIGMDSQVSQDMAAPQDAGEDSAELVGKITYMQDMGLSKSAQTYTEEQLVGLQPQQLKRIHDEVMGTVSEDDMMQDMDQEQAQTGGTLGGAQQGAAGGGKFPPGTAPTMPESINHQGQKTMENVDKDIDLWLGRFKSYDELRASKSAQAMMEKKDTKKEEKDKPEGKEKIEEKDGNPWRDLGKDDKPEAKKGEKTTTHKGGTVTKTDTGLVHKAGDKKEKVDESAGEVDAEILDWMDRFAKLGNMKGYGR